MNRIYRLVWSKAKEKWMVTSEKISTKGGRTITIGALTFAAILTAGSAFALDPGTLPTGGRITAGSGSIATGGNRMTVTQTSQQMIANWDSFNIGANAGVRFNQPNSAATALNRINDQNPSQILGSLTANGKLFLVNPSGIIFGHGSQVNVGSLVASSLNILDSDFLAGKYKFSATSAAGSIFNQGNITANGGVVALIAPKVGNEGTITTNGGSTLLAAANQVSVDFVGDGLISYTVDQGAVDALAENQGLIKADGGMVVMTAKAAGSLTNAVVNNSGVIEASSLTAKGGRIVLEGDEITLAASSILNATGATGGGEVLVGGGLQGSGGLRQATAVTMEQGASIDVSATQKGDGGTAVLWSDIHDLESRTSAHGKILAHGGAAGGDGGRIETSGHWLNVAGIRADASAAKGVAGEWLLDPYNVIIAGAGPAGTAYNSNYSPSADSTILASDIVASLQGGTNVTITTGSSGTSRGDITVNSAITKASGDTDVTLTMRAANSIVVNQKIENTGGTGKLHVTLDADNDNGTADGGGIIILKSDITTNGGNLSFGTGRQLNINGVSTLVGGDLFVGGGSAQSLSTNGGTVDVKGEMLIANTNGLTITSGGGNVRFYGLLNSGNQYTFVDKSGVGETGSWDQARTEAINGSGGGSAVSDSYLATITSRLENAVAGDAAGYTGAWIGAYRSDITKGDWVWSDGPEKDKKFFAQTGSGVGGGSVVSGYYANFGTGEPNGAWSAGGEQVGQFFGTAGQWNDLRMSIPYNEVAAAEQYKVRGFVRETNLAASPLTINAGAGTVTFSGAVGTQKALASLNVTSTGGIAINGGAVTTEGAQTYTGNVTLGAASTVLTQTSANTDFTLQANKTITNATNADASLTIKTTGNIVMNGSSAISSSNGKLNTVLWADSDADGGYVLVNDGAGIATNGGRLVLAGGLDDGSNGGTAGDGTPDGFAKSGTFGVGIGTSGAVASSSATTLQTAGGDITIRGEATAGSLQGVYFSRNGAIDAGTGTLTITGKSSGGHGIEIGAWENGSQTITAGTINFSGTTDNAGSGGFEVSDYGGTKFPTINAGAGGLTIYGESTSGSRGVDLAANISTTGNGSILISSPDTVQFYKNGSTATHTVNAGGGNITLRANGLTFATTNAATLAGSGTLTVEPYTAGTTIGIAGGSGTLSLSASYFSTNFVNGFSGITVGSATAGLVNVGSSALSYNDPLTIKTGNSIFFGGSSALTGNGNKLVLWSRAGGDDAATDATAGAVWLPVGSSISTGGGSVTIGGGSNPATGYALGDSGAGSAENNARYRGVTINGTINAGGGAISILGKGAPNAAARGISIGGAVATTGSGTITMSGIAHGVSDGLALGDATVGINGTISAMNGLVSLSGTKDTGSNGINISTASSAITVSGTGSIALTATGAINGAGYVQAGGTTSLDAGSNAITLTNAANDFTGTVSVVSGTNVSIVDSNAMTLGAVTATGTVDIATLTDDLILTGAIATTNATANAIKLNAGKNATAGTSTGGNIVVSGGSVSTGAGGRATLYSGSVAGSTGLTALIGSGNGKFRYNSDETATNYTATLGDGSHAIYRERPTVNVTAGSNSKTYDGVAFSGGNGANADGFVNGDTLAVLGGTLAYGGTSQGAVNAGSYTITPSGYTNGLGYDLAYADGTLTISKAHLIVTANNQSRIYGAANPAFTQTITGFVNGEDEASAGITGSATGSSAATVTSGVGSYPISGSIGSLSAANYDFTAANGSLTINKAHLTVTADNQSRTYGAANPVFTQTITGFVNGEDAASAGITGSATGSSAATVTSGVGSYTISGSTGSLSAANYDFTAADGSLTINKAHLTVTADNQSRNYATANPVFTQAITGFVNGEDVTGAGITGSAVGSSSATEASPVGTYTITGSTGTLAAANYDFTAADGSLTIVAALQEPIQLPPPPQVVITPQLAPTTTPPPPVTGITSPVPVAPVSAASGVTVQMVAQPTAQGAGVVSVKVPESVARQGSIFSFSLPEEVKAATAGGAVAEKISLSDGGPLPGWLRYQPDSKTFVASDVPAGSLPIKVMVIVGTQNWVVEISKQAER